MSGRKDRSATYQRLLSLIGKRLREVRKDKGYGNYERAANFAEIGRPQWGKYENGHDLNVSTLIHILVSLGVDFNEFFTEELNQAIKDYMKEQ